MFERSKRWYAYTEKKTERKHCDRKTGLERSVCRDQRGILASSSSRVRIPSEFFYNSCEREVYEFQREFETDPAFPVNFLSKRLFLRDTNERQ